MATHCPRDPSSRSAVSAGASSGASMATALVRLTDRLARPRTRTHTAHAYTSARGGINTSRRWEQRNYGDKLGKSLMGVELKTIETDSLVAGLMAVSEP